jgi:hypothetical protein
MTTRNTPPEHTATSQSVKKKKRERRGKTDSKICLITYLAKKNTLVSITADAAPSRSRIFKGLLANASPVTDDKENEFAYAATDEKENEFAYAATDEKENDHY